MAKISFNKLKCKMNEEIKTISFNGEEIEVLQYLPTQEKLALMSRVITASHDEDANHANPIKIKVFIDLEILYAYTNITFTEKQKENIPKVYDIVYSSGLLEEVKKAIPKAEYDLIYNGVFESLEAVYNYIHSALGILETLLGKYGKDVENIDIQELYKQVQELSNSPLIKDLAPALGLNIENNI